MLLKRLYDRVEGWVAERDSDGTLRNPLPIKALSLKHTGTHPEQNFSRRLVETGLAEGWISMGKGALTLHTEEEDLTYTIVRMPGMYCCHCAARLEEDPSGATGRAHVEAAHNGLASPDPRNPAGFQQTHGYECVLDDAQHARWSAQAVAAKALGAIRQAVTSNNGAEGNDG